MGSCFQWQPHPLGLYCISAFIGWIKMEFGWIINLIGIAFNGLRWAIESILNMTLFKVNPDLSEAFASTIALLVSLTAAYILLVVVSAGKKILGIIILLGWALLIVSMIISAI